jgi:hypothetical protein
LDHDDSTKTGIPAANLPPNYLTRLNGLFHQLGEYAFRPRTWQHHANDVWQTRQKNLNALERLIAVLSLHFRKHGIHELRTPALIESFQNAIAANRSPLNLPQNFVDEWGFVSEGMAEQTKPVAGSSAQPRVRQVFAFAKHKVYRDALGEYTTHVQNFFHQATQALDCLSYIGRLKDPALRQKLNQWMEEHSIRAEPGSLPAINLADTIKGLSLFQQEFRKRFSSFFESSELDTLERQERQIFLRAFSLWIQFAFHPVRSSIPDPVNDAERRFQATLKNCRRQIIKAFEKFKQDEVVARIASESIVSETRPDLWIIFDTQEPTRIYQAFEQVYLAIVNALPHGSLQAEHHAVLVTWHNLWIVPCVQGQALGNIGWRISMMTLVVDPPLTPERWLHFIPIQVPSSAWKQLNLKIIEHPRYEVMKKFRLAATQITALIGHTASLDELSKIGTLDHYILETYLNKQSVRISKLQQQLDDFGTEIFNYAIDHIDGLEERPHLQLVVDALKAIGDELRSNSNTESSKEFSIADIVVWRNKFISVGPALELLYLAWVGDILANA